MLLRVAAARRASVLLPSSSFVCWICVVWLPLTSKAICKCVSFSPVLASSLISFFPPFCSSSSIQRSHRRFSVILHRPLSFVVSVITVAQGTAWVPSSHCDLLCSQASVGFPPFQFSPLLALDATGKVFLIGLLCLGLCLST